MILETRHLRLVAAVAEHGTLTKAGRVLHLTQSGLSRQLLDLETRLGLPLFHRLGKRMVSTPAGERLLAAARRTLPQLGDVEEELRRLAGGRAAILRVSTECYTCYHWLPGVLARFGRRFPGVDVQIVAEVTHHPVPALLDGRLDLAIISNEDRDDRLAYVPLFSDELVAVLRADHPLAARRFLAAADFADQHLFVYLLPTAENDVFTLFLEPAGVTPRRVSAIQLTEAILELVRAGTGVAVLARWAVRPHLKTGELRAVPLTRRGLERRWRAAMLRQSPLPLHLREFARLLAAGPAALARRSAREA
jgi:LysR family transcriptional regulator for metE and metH